MTVTVELPSDVESVLQRKAQNAGISMPDLLLRLARAEAVSPRYMAQKIEEFLGDDRLTPELSSKAQRLLGH